MTVLIKRAKQRATSFAVGECIGRGCARRGLVVGSPAEAPAPNPGSGGRPVGRDPARETGPAEPGAWECASRLALPVYSSPPKTRPDRYIHTDPGYGRQFFPLLLPAVKSDDAPSGERFNYWRIPCKRSLVNATHSYRRRWAELTSITRRSISLSPNFHRRIG